MTVFGESNSDETYAHFTINAEAYFIQYQYYYLG